MQEGRGNNKGAIVRPDLRLAIYLRDRFQCQYCGRDLHGAKAWDLTLDHLVCQRGLRSGNGLNDPANLVTACRACNCSRQDRKWTAFATGGAKERIQKVRRLAIGRYRTLAKDLLADGLKVGKVKPKHYC